MTVKIEKVYSLDALPSLKPGQKYVLLSLEFGVAAMEKGDILGENVLGIISGIGFEWGKASESAKKDFLKASRSGREDGFDGPSDKFVASIVSLADQLFAAGKVYQPRLLNRPAPQSYKQFCAIVPDGTNLRDIDYPICGNGWGLGGAKIVPSPLLS